MNEVDEYLQWWAMEGHIALITKVCAKSKSKTISNYNFHFNSNTVSL